MTDVNKIIAYEEGELGTQETVELFAELIKSGQAWRLQGHYGRQAKNFIDEGIIDHAGTINQERLDEVMDSYGINS